MSVVSRLKFYDGYGFALLLRGRHSVQHVLDELNSGNGVPVLDVSEGVDGVLRAMSIRVGPCLLHHHPGWYTVGYARMVDGAPVMEWWVLDVKPRKENNHVIA
jgi:hypothetical protein